MFKHDVVQIVDLYPRPTGSHEVTPKVDPDEEGKSLSMLVLPLGRDARKIAIVSKNDERRLLAFQRAGYETHSMNGNRPAELRQLMRQLAADIQRTEPKNTVLVSEDPQFVHFCDAVGPHTTLHVWANSLSAPHELMETNYNFRPLEELLPNLKVSNVDVRIDLENIVIGLVKRGFLLRALRGSAARAGGNIWVSDLFGYISRNVRRFGCQHTYQKAVGEDFVVMVQPPKALKQTTFVPGKRLDQRALRRHIHSSLNRAELSLLCHDLGLTLEDLSGTTLEAQIMELIDYCYRHGIYDQLVQNTAFNHVEAIA